MVMRPGWHVFAGPGGLFWDPGSFASGAYAVSSTIFLFPEGDPEQSGSTRLDSSFGLFVAGDGLEGAAPGYLTFEIRNDGQFRVAEHSGGKENDLVSWTRHDAVETLSADATGPLKNVLGVDVRGDRVVFYVNEAEVAELRRRACRSTARSGSAPEPASACTSPRSTSARTAARSSESGRSP